MTYVGYVEFAFKITDRFISYLTYLSLPFTAIDTLTLHVVFFYYGLYGDLKSRDT